MNFNNDKFLEFNKNIVKWYDFESDKNALVIGDKSGKVSDYLSQKLSQVTVLEQNDESYDNLISKSMLLKNISVLKKDILSVDFDEKFQYNRIYPTFDFNESDSLLLSTKTSILVNESSTNKIFISTPFLLCKKGMPIPVNPHSVCIRS